MGVVRWYGVDIRNLTFAELWRIAPGIGFLVGAGCKILRIPLRMTAQVPVIDSLDLLEEASIPGPVSEAMAPLVRAWQERDFVPAFRYTLPPVNQDSRSFACSLLSRDGRTLAEVACAENGTGAQWRREIVCWCFSVLRDGSRLGVNGGRKRMDSAPGFDALYLPGAPPEMLYRVHLQRLERAGASGPVPMDGAMAQRVLVENNNRSAEYLAGRGVYVPLREGGPAPIVPQ